MRTSLVRLLGATILGCIFFLVVNDMTQRKPISINDQVETGLPKYTINLDKVHVYPTEIPDCRTDVTELFVTDSALQSSEKDDSFLPKTVLVLGSGGLVGSALVRTLRNMSYEVFEVQNRYDVDLRQDGSLEPLLSANAVEFCFFLACEVGGSKFLSEDHMQQLSDLYSERMQQAVIRSLAARKIPFLFASSQLAVNNRTSSPYAEVKKRGERLTLENGGKVFRIWNAYGPEPIGFKSHVISDWVYRCLEVGEVLSSTDGVEARRFMHVDNMAMALIAMMRQFPLLRPATDLAPEVPTTMRELAAELAKEVPGGCNFTFSKKKAYYPSSAEPSNHFVVPGSLRCGLRKLVAYYSDLRQRRASGDVYLSIITASTNDDYNGIRGRLFTFLHFLGEQLKGTSMRYEVILVQYNPKITEDYYSGEYSKDTARETDLPISQLFPLTSGIVSLSPLRILTVPPEYHRFHDRGRFWEYIAKNVGAQAARGKYLAFTNVDNLYPTTLISWLGKEQLLPNRWYRSGMLEGEYRDQSSCDKVGTGHATCHKKKICLPQFVEETKEGYCDVCLGDFSIFPKESFFASGGYLETPQNTHVETAHMIFFEGVPSLQTVSSVWMDETLCHRSHTRNDRPSIPNDFNELANQMRSRGPDSEWGLKNAIRVLPESYLGNGVIWDWGFNPETPFQLWRHSSLFEELFPIVVSAPFDKDYHLDFAGTKTKYVYDCENWFRYRRYHMSRRFVCDRMDVFSAYKLGSDFAHVPIYGDLPVIDEEYFEWQSLLTALKFWKVNAIRPFVVAEMGARYGTWAARGGVMARRIRPDVGAHVCAIEGDSVGFSWLQEHMSINRLAENATLIRGMVGAGGTQAAVQWEPGSSAEAIRVYTIQEILEKYLVVDIVHVNIQGAETVLYDPSVQTFLKDHVRFLHIGTHSAEILRDLKAIYLGGSTWSEMRSFEGSGSKIMSEWGPITFAWDGEIAIRNLELAPFGLSES